MLQLFVAPTPFEGWGERAYDGTSQRQLLAVLIVSVGALALTLCVALLMLFANEPLGPPENRFPIPAGLVSFAAWRWKQRVVPVRLPPKANIRQRIELCLLCAMRWGNRPAYLWIAEDLGCCASD
jgi:hypothetical protein